MEKKNKSLVALNQPTDLLVQSSANNELLVDARLLHQRLDVGKKFSDWIKTRIVEFGFNINEDYFTSQKREAVLKGGGHNKVDYHLTVDMAKELSMLERNETGRTIRRYFIAAEKEARLNSAVTTALPGTVTKGIARLAANINGRRLYPYCKLLLHIGANTGGSAYKRRRLYPNHFVEFNKMVYCTEEMAGLIYANRQIYAMRKNVRNMQPVLPLGFGEPLRLGGM